ncbi:MAG: N-acetyltransferase [Clostridia bacterium]|nr:N-acetyltransferase [Clostridia bacterium]MBN2883952.1 N-acetyltransferase [Clostridia bacterium]
MVISVSVTDEIPALVDIYNHYVRNTTVTFNTQEVDGKQFLDAFYADKSKYTLHTVYVDDKIIGFCSLNPFNKKEAYRRSAYISIYLDPSSTGKGLGRDILKFLEQQAMDMGYRSLIALISKENVTSCSFFEKNGYLRAGELRQAGEKFGRLLDVVYYQKLN